VVELAEVLDSLLALPAWPDHYDGGPDTVAALKNLTSELIGRFSVAAQQATLDVFGPTDVGSHFSHSTAGPSLTRYAADLVVPRQQRLECALLKGITAHYVMSRAEAAAAHARERELLAELTFAIERDAPRSLDPLLRPSWDAAESDAVRRRVVIDQVASLTDTSAIAWHHRLCAPDAS
jgi:dGTPase